MRSSDAIQPSPNLDCCASSRSLPLCLLITTLFCAGAHEMVNIVNIVNIVRVCIYGFRHRHQLAVCISPPICSPSRRPNRCHSDAPTADRGPAGMLCSDVCELAQPTKRSCPQLFVITCISSIGSKSEKAIGASDDVLYDLHT